MRGDDKDALAAELPPFVGENISSFFPHASARASAGDAFRLSRLIGEEPPEPNLGGDNAMDANVEGETGALLPPAPSLDDLVGVLEGDQDGDEPALLFGDRRRAE